MTRKSVKYPLDRMWQNGNRQRMSICLAPGTVSADNKPIIDAFVDFVEISPPSFWFEVDTIVAV
jgi:hypothetical protein